MRVVASRGYAHTHTQKGAKEEWIPNTIQPRVSLVTLWSGRPSQFRHEQANLFDVKSIWKD